MERRSAQQGVGDGDSPVPRSLTRQVIGAFYSVYNELRFGFLEGVYCNALAHELRDLDIPFEREPRIEVVCKGRAVGLYRPDFVVASRIVLEVKATQSIGPPDARQLLNCLRATNLELGFLLHFGPEASFHRIISSRPRGKRPPA